MIWIYTVSKGRVYPGSAGQGLRLPCLSGMFKMAIWHYISLSTHIEIIGDNEKFCAV